jgi:hypothetical protein
MKTFFTSILAIALTAMAFTAQAQSPGLYSQISGGTNYVASGATNTYATLTQAVGDYENVGIMFGYLGRGAGCTNTITLVGYRMTGNEWDTAPLVRLGLVGAGASRVVASTNISYPSAAAIGKWVIEHPTNGGSDAATNLTVQVRLLRKTVNSK